MQTFIDANGKSWTLRLDWQAMRRAKAAGVDLSKIEETLPDLYRCGVELVEAVWACLDLRGGPVNRDDFEAALCGECMEAARKALIEAINDFFPEHRRRFVLAACVEVERQFAKLAESALATQQPSGQSTESPASSA